MYHVINSTIVSFIADHLLRAPYVGGAYREVLRPMTVPSRLDAVLGPTKEAVLEKKFRWMRRA